MQMRMKNCMFYVDEYMVVTNGRYELKIRNYKNKAIKFYWFMS